MKPPATWLLCLLTALLSCPLAKSDPKFVVLGFNGKVPEWKMKKGKAENIIKNGDTVYISTNVFPDPVDGIYHVDQEGFVKVKLFNAKIKIGGLSEIEASAKLLKQGKAEDLYAGEARFYVLDATKK